MPYADREKHIEYDRQWAKSRYCNDPEYRAREIARTSKRTKDRRAWYRELKKNQACELCGENHPACLDFHHKDKHGKAIGISVAIGKCWTTERILAEIAKCRVLCSNCHRKLHYDEKTVAGE